MERDGNNGYAGLAGGSGGGGGGGEGGAEVGGAIIGGVVAITESIVGQVVAGRRQRAGIRARQQAGVDYVRQQAERGRMQSLSPPIPWGIIAIAGAGTAVLIGGVLLFGRSP